MEKRKYLVFPEQWDEDQLTRLFARIAGFLAPLYVSRNAASQQDTHVIEAQVMYLEPLNSSRGRVMLGGGNNHWMHWEYVSEDEPPIWWYSSRYGAVRTDTQFLEAISRLDTYSIKLVERN